MKFALVDRILELVPRKRIVVVKAVTLAEEYLADHFPTFPVLPGVLMLEVMAQAGAWLVREAEDFASSVILLRESRNVTYKSFVKPGHVLKVEVTCRGLARSRSDFSGVGYCNNKEVVKARFGLRHFCLADRDRALEDVDRELVAKARRRFALLQS